MNISLNENATLTCTAVTQHLIWRVNGINVDEILDSAFDSQITLDKSIGAGLNVYTGRLRILGTPSTNRSQIDCSAFYLSLDGVFSFNSSEPVLIQVQGVLGSVENLDVNIQGKNIQVTWDPPYTINGVSVTRYEVVVGILASFSTERNITTVSHSLEELLAYDKVNYTVCVRPVNMAGKGAETKNNVRVTLPVLSNIILASVNRTELQGNPYHDQIVIKL